MTRVMSYTVVTFFLVFSSPDQGNGCLLTYFSTPEKVCVFIVLFIVEVHLAFLIRLQALPPALIINYNE